MKKSPTVPTKAAIFDLGGVLLALSHADQDTAFRRLGAERAFSELSADPAAKRVLDAFEVGELAPNEFRHAIAGCLGLAEVESEKFDDAFATILGSFLEGNLALVEALRPHRRLFLLSNTNSLHVPLFESLYERRFGRPLSALFDAVYYSNEMRLRKPEPETFLRIVREHALEPGETLFVDDLAENRAAAATIGLLPIATATNAPLPPLPE